MGMPNDRKRHCLIAVAGTVIVAGASAILQANGGMIGNAYADELPKESIRPGAQKPAQPAQPAVQQPKEKGGKKNAGTSGTAPPK